MITTLLVSILFVFHDTEPFEPIDNNIKVDINFYDWAFMSVQEQWVMDNTAWNNGEIVKNIIPNNVYKWIKRLDADCYKCREIACKKLKGLKNRDYLYLLWIYNHASLEQQKHLYHIIGHHAKCWVVHESEVQKCQVCFGINQFWPISALEAEKHRKSVLVKGDWDRKTDGDWIPN